MRRITLILAAVLALIALPRAAGAADLTGKWSGTMEAVNNARGPITDSHYMTLRQDGASVTGTTGPKPDVQWDIRNGRVEGNKLTFEATAGTLELAFSLNVDGDALAGTAVVKNRQGINWKVTMKRDR